MKLTCSCCGKNYNIDSYIRTCELLPLIKEEQLCFTCAFWVNISRNPNDTQQIVDGKCYIFENWDAFNTKYVDSTTYVIVNGCRTIKSNHIILVGTVPEHLRELLPDTAKFVDKKIYSIIHKNEGYQCQSKGCWDRYHCVWYNMPEPDGPWNTVPTRHKIGGECCPIFIDKFKI